MQFSSKYDGRTDQFAGLFRETFTQSENAEEGRTVGALARGLLETTPPQDLCVFSAWDEDHLLGCIIFSRMRFAGDDRSVFILSPVAIATEEQSKGTGEALLTHGLNTLKAEGVDVALTYGNPDYYRRVGFSQLTSDMAAPPFPLSQPHGWLGQSLTAAPLHPLKGASRCVPALDDPAYW